MFPASPVAVRGLTLAQVGRPARASRVPPHARMHVRFLHPWPNVEPMFPVPPASPRPPRNRARSPRQAARAEALSREAGLTDARFMVADALKMPFADAEFGAGGGGEGSAALSLIASGWPDAP